MIPTDLRAFRRSLMNWYRQNGRDLPWRHTQDPYAILVSEVMLQQTQVATVLPHYEKWLRRFPDFRSLAHASENDVLHQWQGLGYYSRARNLHAAAKLIQDRYCGIFPRDIDSIRELPAVGRYTANAVATFAFDHSVPVVEANVARLISRLFNIRNPIDSSMGREALWHRAAFLVPRRNAARFNSALMDIGATVCLPRKPKCSICPVKKFCQAKNPELLPIKRTRPTTKLLIETHALILRKNKILLEQSRGRWRKMWILPPLKLVRFNRTSSPPRAAYVSVFPFTHHQVTLKVFHKSPRKIDNSNQRWFRKRALETIPIPSPHRRALAVLLRH